MFASLSKTNVRTFGVGEASWCTCDLTSKVSVKNDDYSLHASFYTLQVRLLAEEAKPSILFKSNISHIADVLNLLTTNV